MKVLSSYLYTIGIILIGSLITSVLYYFNITSDKLNMIFLYAVSILAIFIGSIKISKNLKYKGIINGIIYFLSWFIIMIFLSLVVFKNNFTFKNLIYYVVLIVFSIFGGILGKNIENEKDVNDI